MIPSLFVAPGAAWASGDMVAVMIFSVVYFVVLLVVAFEPHEPSRRGRHRRDLSAGAW